MWEATSTGPQPCWVISRLVEPGDQNPEWCYFIVNQATLQWRQTHYDPMYRQLGTDLYHDYQAARERSIQLGRDRLKEIATGERKRLEDEQQKIDAALKKMLRET